MTYARPCACAGPAAAAHSGSGRRIGTTACSSVPFGPEMEFDLAELGRTGRVCVALEEWTADSDTELINAALIPAPDILACACAVTWKYSHSEESLTKKVCWVLSPSRNRAAGEVFLLREPGLGYRLSLDGAAASNGATAAAPPLDVAALREIYALPPALDAGGVERFVRSHVACRPL
eukprot:gnl/Chilomastix_cuspidata/1284.p1 GENE.gnl/Chilomastix_cuspidata/1284~~gnl/Chilomastix_cuspidata/1284.p1  ORF type:complete len:178 (+),score=46.04 gnl/Chilomastix_cuspidata/1284:659-1192(+)